MYIGYGMSWRSIVIVVTLILAAIDEWFDGVVSRAVGTTLENNTVMIEDLMCWIGYSIYAPTMDVHGFTVPYPSFFNVAVAFILATFLLILIEFYITKISFKHKLLFIVGVWIVIKIIGYSMMLSVNECTTWAATKYGDTNSVYTATSLIGSFLVFAKWGLKK